MWYKIKNYRAVTRLNFGALHPWSWMKLVFLPCFFDHGFRLVLWKPLWCSSAARHADGWNWSQCSSTPLDSASFQILLRPKCLQNDDFPLLLRPLPHLSPAPLIPSPRLYEEEEEPPRVPFSSHLLNANLFPLFSKFLWLFAQFRFSFCLLSKYFTSCSSFPSFSCLPLLFYF